MRKEFIFGYAMVVGLLAIICSGLYHINKLLLTWYYKDSEKEKFEEKPIENEE